LKFEQVTGGQQCFHFKRKFSPLQRNCKEIKGNRIYKEMATGKESCCQEGNKKDITLFDLFLINPIIIIINKLYLHDLITGIAKRNRKYIKVN
jgi:hypothetical protein